MIKFDETHNDLVAAKDLDKNDDLYSLRNEFHFPLVDNGERCLYFTGHSLGLMPKQAEDYIQEELNAWKAFGVEGPVSYTHLRAHET